MPHLAALSLPSPSMAIPGHSNLDPGLQPHRGVATEAAIDRHLAALEHYMSIADGYVELYRMNQFIAEKP